MLCVTATSASPPLLFVHCSGLACVILSNWASLGTQCIKNTADRSIFAFSRLVSHKLSCSCIVGNIVETCLPTGDAAWSQVCLQGQHFLTSSRGPADALPALLHCSALATAWSLHQGSLWKQASKSGALSVLQHNLPAGTALGLGGTLRGTCANPMPGNQAMLPQMEADALPLHTGASTGSPPIGGVRLDIMPALHQHCTVSLVLLSEPTSSRSRSRCSARACNCCTGCAMMSSKATSW